MELSHHDYTNGDFVAQKPLAFVMDALPEPQKKRVRRLSLPAKTSETHWIYPVSSPPMGSTLPGDAGWILFRLIVLGITFLLIPPLLLIALQSPHINL